MQTISKESLMRTLTAAECDDILALAALIEAHHRVEIVRQPTKTLVMLRAKESVKNELFYLGELLAMECLVRVDSQYGTSVLAGSDSQKCLALAIIDAAHTASFAEIEHILPEINKLEEKRLNYLKQEAVTYAKTQVRFRVKEDRHVD